MAKKVTRFEPGGRHAARNNVREIPHPQPVQDMPDPVEHPALQTLSFFTPRLYSRK